MIKATGMQMCVSLSRLMMATVVQPAWILCLQCYACAKPPPKVVCFTMIAQCKQETGHRDANVCKQTNDGS